MQSTLGTNHTKSASKQAKTVIHFINLSHTHVVKKVSFYVTISHVPQEEAIVCLVVVEAPQGRLQHLHTLIYLQYLNTWSCRFYDNCFQFQTMVGMGYTESRTFVHPNICSPLIFEEGGHLFTRWITTPDICSPIQLLPQQLYWWTNVQSGNSTGEQMSAPCKNQGWTKIKGEQMSVYQVNSQEK